MVAPLVLAAGIGAAGSALGGVMGGKGAKKAAKTAAKSQEKITQMNNALVQGMYNSNAMRLDPYIQGGTRAGNVLMELLLGPTPTTGGGTSGGGSTVSPQFNEWNNIVGYRSDDISDNFTPAALSWIQSNQGLLPANYAGPSWAEIMAMPTGKSDNARDNAIQQFGSVLAANAANTTPAGATSNATGQPTSALSAWDQFRNSTNYQWQLDQGLKAVNQGYAGAGALDSGAAQIALNDYAQNQAQGALAGWMNMLAGQQGVGLQAGGALAGVGMQATNAQMANNQALGSANGNAALIGGMANQNMWGNIGQGIGQIAGAWGSSYDGPGGVGAYSMPYAGYHRIGSQGDIVTSNPNSSTWGGGMW
jgi:hypothetical protein